jgi:hypothetical protein
VKTFFVLMALTSIASLIYNLASGLKTMSHNHYDERHYLIYVAKDPPHRSESLGLTPKELARCDQYVADAYKESVRDGYRLGTGYSWLSLQCLGLEALLFVSSLVGIRAVRRSRGSQMSNQSVQPTPTREDAGGRG